MRQLTPLLLKLVLLCLALSPALSMSGCEEEGFQGLNASQTLQAYDLAAAGNYYLDVIEEETIPLIEVPGLRNYRAAFSIEAGSWIEYDPELNVSPTLHRWFVAHEVGHHFLGHTRTTGASIEDRQRFEREADTFAARVCEILEPESNNAARNHFRGEPATDVHDPGEDRIELIQRASQETRVLDQQGDYSTLLPALMAD